ncbi:hypothetical protein DL770_003528 [Monosporascus sp. CRB-9-2]|nr:hypothetical protein DL770_003528 [Monosporascus sp. CRB-9-2]
MADPVSVVGLVAGLASLGIQVCGGITDYLDAVKSRAEDVASARRQAQCFKSVLQIIQTTVTQVDSNHRVSTTAVVECIKSCETELRTLESFVSELTGDVTSPANFKDKIKEQSRKLSYAFNRSKLDQLEARLARANGIFQTAQGSDVIVGRLLAKPSTLRAFCDEVAAPLDEAQTGLKGPSRPFGTPLLRGSVTGSGTNCICRRRQRYQQHRLRLGTLEVYDETTVIEEHLPDCQISQILPRRRHRSLGVKYTGAAKLLNRVVNMAFSMTFGAGGFSIAPVFTYYATVDDQTAPAFRLLHIVKDAAISLECRGSTLLAEFVETVLNKILKLFRERKATPTDVDSRNRTILHPVGNITADMLRYRAGDSASLAVDALTLACNKHMIVVLLAWLFWQMTWNRSNISWQNCFDLLLHAGSAYPLEWKPYYFQAASMRSKLKYAKELQSRRERLKHLALENLSHLEAEDLGLCDGNVLDTLTGRVIKQLRKHHVPVPAALLPFDSGFVSDTGWSVYCDLKSTTDAELFFQLGFRDLNTANAFGHAPLAYAAHNYAPVSCLLWLREHGADLFDGLEYSADTPPEDQGPSSAYFHTCCNPGPWARNCRPSYDFEEIQEIEEEQAALLEILEDLVEEFEEKVINILEQETTETLAALGEFWTGYWCDRMEGVLDDLNGAMISDEDRLAAERIGVRWDDEPEDEPDEEDKSDIRYWYRRLNEIA